jgi:hypothetical protein
MLLAMSETTNDRRRHGVAMPTLSPKSTVPPAMNSPGDGDISGVSIRGAPGCASLSGRCQPVHTSSLLDEMI